MTQTTTPTRSGFPSPALRTEAAGEFTPAAEPPPPAPLPPVEKPPRLLSLDAYRGLIMIVLATGGLGFVEMARQTRYDVKVLAPTNDLVILPKEGKNQVVVADINHVLHIRIFDGDGKMVVDKDETRFPDQAQQLAELRQWIESIAPGQELTPGQKGLILDRIAPFIGHRLRHPVWEFLAFHTDHVPWVGCSFWDLIQPSFMFMVGVAVPYSYAARKAKGQSEAVVWAHNLWRSLLLVALGVFLTSNGRSETDFQFMNVLTQIGLGYPFVCALRGFRPRWQLLAIGVILVGTWLLFFCWPLPPAGVDAWLNYFYGAQAPDKFDHALAGRPPEWVYQQGLFTHWEKNANVGTAFDFWFLNRFRRATPFVFNREGYQTLNFIPSIATMLLGLMAGERLRRSDRPQAKFVWLVGVGVVCLVLGILAGWFVCPLVKRIWTPSWVLYSSGWTFLMLAAFFGVVDVLGYRRWAFPLVVVGVNSIAMYMMGQLMKGWVRGNLVTHFGQAFENPWAPVLKAAAVAAVLWLICLWMYRRGIYLKV
jgi:heparan-alpha-glucosaminide N-acetyltransferase